MQDIRGHAAPTRIADVPHSIKGVVSLRGVIVPVIGMRLRFGLADVQYKDFTGLIVLNVTGRTIGVVVDSVREVLELPPQQVRLAPKFNRAVDLCFITGIVTLRTGGAERMLMLMDIEALMRSPEMCWAEPGTTHRQRAPPRGYCSMTSAPAGGVKRKRAASSGTLAW